MDSNENNFTSNVVPVAMFAGTNIIIVTHTDIPLGIDPTVTRVRSLLDVCSLQGNTTDCATRMYTNSEQANYTLTYQQLTAADEY